MGGGGDPGVGSHPGFGQEGRRFPQIHGLHEVEAQTFVKQLVGQAAVFQGLE